MNTLAVFLEVSIVTTAKAWALSEHAQDQFSQRAKTLRTTGQ